jgi:drug/metabolite transporter (DMT)-like permease
MSSRRYATDLGLIFVVIVWGFSPTIFKYALAELQPLAFVFVRFLLLSLVAVAVLTVRGLRGGTAWRVARGDLPALILSGLCGYGIYQLLYMVGLSHTTVFSSALLTTTVPLWSLAIVALLRLERVHPMQWVGVGVSLLGTAGFLLAASGARPEIALGHTLGAREQLFGDLLSLGAAVLFAGYGVVNRGLVKRYSPPELMCYTLLVGTLALAPLGIPAVVAQDWSRVTWQVWLIIPYTVIFPIYITYSIWNWAIGRRGVGYVTLYSYLVPVLGGVIAFLLLGETLSLGQYVAGAVVLGGMLLARVGIRLVALRARRTASLPEPSAPLPSAPGMDAQTPSADPPHPAEARVTGG